MQVSNPAEQMEFLQKRVSQVSNLLVDVTQEKINIGNAFESLQKTTAANNQRVIDTCNAVRGRIKATVAEPTASEICAMFDSLIGPMPEQQNVVKDTVA